MPYSILEEPEPREYEQSNGDGKCHNLREMSKIRHIHNLSTLKSSEGAKNMFNMVFRLRLKYYIIVIDTFLFIIPFFKSKRLLRR